MGPLVSVGMGVYNRPEQFAQALQSVVNQTYKNIEIIISEDCSPCEKTKQVIADWAAKDERIRVFKQSKNLGGAKNLRFVLMQAAGEYFMWADDDDFRDELYIEALLSKFMSGKNVAVSLGRVVSIDGEGRAVREFDSLQYSGIRPLRLAKYFLTEERDGKANIVCGLFKTEFLKMRKHWSEYRFNRFGGGDYLFVLDCIQHGNVIVDPSVCVYKRLPVYDEQFLKNGPSQTQKALRQLEYYVACLGVVRNWFDKTILTLLIPVRVIRTILFEVSILARAAISKVIRTLRVS